MARYRSYSAEFKRQVVLESLSGECSLKQLAKRHGLHATLIEFWREKYAQGGFETDLARENARAAEDGRVAALERKVGQLIMENELLKKILRDAPSGNDASSSISYGPTASDARKDADS
jgi:transposase